MVGLQKELEWSGFNENIIDVYEIKQKIASVILNHFNSMSKLAGSLKCIETSIISHVFIFLSYSLSSTSFGITKHS